MIMLVEISFIVARVIGKTWELWEKAVFQCKPFEFEKIEKFIYNNVSLRIKQTTIIEQP